MISSYSEDLSQESFQSVQRTGTLRNRVKAGLVAQTLELPALELEDGSAGVKEITDQLPSLKSTWATCKLQKHYKGWQARIKLEILL